MLTAKGMAALLPKVTLILWHELEISKSKHYLDSSATYQPPRDVTSSVNKDFDLAMYVMGFSAT